MKRKRKNTKCPLTTTRDEGCPLQPGSSPASRAQQPSIVIVRTERRSWITLAITGFGAVLLRYLRTIRERGQVMKKTRNSR